MLPLALHFSSLRVKILCFHFLVEANSAENATDAEPGWKGQAGRVGGGVEGGCEGPEEGEVVDVDTTHLGVSDHWAVLDHTGQRVLSPPAGGAGGQECCMQPFVSLHYLIKLRKKIGPSLLAGGR